MLRLGSFVVTATLFAASACAQQPAPDADGDAQMAQTGPRSFHVRVENVSTAATLQLSNGETAPAPTAPTLWVVHTTPNPLFIAGEADRGMGLESLAEEGDPSALAAALDGAEGVVSAGAAAVPVGDESPGPLTPGKSYEFELSGAPGQWLTLAMMFAQSNDWFYAPEGGIPLFGENGEPLSGDITSRLSLWDAGTEVNEEPGLGPNQAPRQAAPNTGPTENGTVTRVADGPSIEDVVRVTVTPVMEPAAE